MRILLALACIICMILIGCSGGGGDGFDVGVADDGSNLGNGDGPPSGGDEPPESPPDGGDDGDGGGTPDDGGGPPPDTGDIPPGVSDLPPDDGNEIPPDGGGGLPPDDGGGEPPPDDNDDGNGDDDGDDNVEDDCDYSFVDETWEPDSDPVWFFNAQFYNNRTVRWHNGAVHVRVNDERIDLDALQTIFDEINALIRPAYLIIFNNNSSNYDVEIKYGPDWENWGYTTWLVDSDYELYSATIEMGDFEDIDCHFYAVLKHQIIQAVGFFNYTEDGGVMTQGIYNDLVTSIVQETLQLLYDMRAGTEIRP